MANKRIIVINGKGGSGKDTLVSDFIAYTSKKYFSGICDNISSISPAENIMNHIRELSSSFGKEVPYEKTDEYRRMLHIIKTETDKYCNLSMNYLLHRLSSLFFKDINKKFIFVHIREPENIKTFCDILDAILLCNAYHKIDNRLTIDVKTLLVESNMTDGKQYGNHADDNVKAYDYDFYFRNDFSTEVSAEQILSEYKTDVESFYKTVTCGMDGIL